MKASIYLPQGHPTSQAKIACVVFLHTRGGCRLEGLFLRTHFLPKMALCVFDFAGSGHSEGEYITLGPKEKRDTKSMIDHLRKQFGVSSVFLWGRSMGAVTSILFAGEYPNEISGIILDAPFSDLKIMVQPLGNLGGGSGDIPPQCASLFDRLRFRLSPEDGKKKDRRQHSEDPPRRPGAQHQAASFLHGGQRRYAGQTRPSQGIVRQIRGR
jgi:pimeloyl-ACP methyl ester carboxylesterase